MNSAQAKELASLLGGESLALNPCNKGGAGSEETGSTNIGSWVLGAAEKGLANSSDDIIRNIAAVFVDDVFNLTSGHLACRALEGRKMGVVLFLSMRSGLDLLKAVEGA